MRIAGISPPKVGALIATRIRPDIITRRVGMSEYANWMETGERLYQEWEDVQPDGRLGYDIQQGFDYAWELAWQEIAGKNE